MSSVTCECGRIIDTDWDLPLSGKLIAEADVERIICATRDEIFSFFQAVAAGKRDEWLVKRYSRVIDISDESVLYESSCRHWLSKSNSMPVYQCPNCRRLLIASRKPGDLYRSFQPEQSEGRNLFANDTAPAAQ